MPLRDPLATSDDQRSSLTPKPSAANATKGLSLGAPRSRTVAARSAASGSTVDDAVRQTDSDALISRLSALRLGYLPAEPYTHELSVPASSVSRRSPLINIGTYLRCSQIDAIVEQFLTETQTPVQIVSIGAGSDSRYWRIKSSESLSKHLAHYLEIDFAENTRQKLSRIGKSALLRSFLRDAVDSGENDMSSTTYSLRAADVRLLPLQAAEAERVFGMLDSALPTLVLFECVLSYMDGRSGDSLIAWLSRRFPQMQAVVYDIGLTGDANGSEVTRFGGVMLQNLEARHLSLPGAHAYPSMASQVRRFPTPRSHTSTSSSLFAIWQSLDQQQRTRLSRLEGLDEVEELEMLLRHYYLLHIC